jgi:hypothetical protein
MAGRGGAVAQLGERLVRNEEVSGSIPLGSTSLRSLRELRLGKPAQAYRSEVSEGCRAVARRAKAGRPPVFLCTFASYGSASQPKPIVAK